jgi:hypothetical protein
VEVTFTSGVFQTDVNTFGKIKAYKFFTVWCQPGIRKQGAEKSVWNRTKK